MSEFLAKEFDNFLSKEEIDLVLSYIKNAANWREIPGNFWDNRTINLGAVEDKKVSDKVKEIILRVQQTLIKEYNLSSKPYADTVDLIRWFPGMKQVPHCDDMTDNEGEKPKFFHRYFGTVIFLNDNYEGGRTYYPDHNFEIIPKPGKLIAHLGDCNHRHGVTPVEKELRYTVASFWTFDKSKAAYFIDWE